MDPKKQKILLGVLVALILGTGAYYTLGGSGPKQSTQATGEVTVRREKKKVEEPKDAKRKERKQAEESKPEVSERKVKEEKEVVETKRKEPKKRSEKIEKKKGFGMGA